MIINLGQKGLDNLDGFLKTLINLLVKQKIVFDLIIGPGDSGITMVKISEIVYNETKLQLPPKLLIPYFRYQKKDITKGIRFSGNDVLVSAIKDELLNIGALNNILFVDDEIGNGSTVKGIIRLVAQARPDLFKNKPTLYILAEDHGFDPKAVTDRIFTKFIPFATKIEGVHNAISYIVPKKLEKPIDELYPDTVYNDKARMNALLDLPIKVLKNGKPIWSYEFIEKLDKKIPNFKQMQREFKNYLVALVRKLTLLLSPEN